LFVNRAQKEIGRVGAGRARPRGQRRRGFGQGKFEPLKKEVEKKRENLPFLKERRSLLLAKEHKIYG
jgi:hypothetical protein